MDVRIVSAPENGSDSSLTWATWALVAITGALCWVTWRSAKAALRDAGRLRREALERDVNTAAHKAAAAAEHVGQLAARVPHANEQLLSFSNSGQAVPTDHPITVAAAQRVSRTEEIKGHALALISTRSGDTSDAQLAAAQRRLDADVVQLEVMKEAIAGELVVLARQIDAAQREAAAAREQHRLVESRVNSEVGQCNKLIFILGQMLSTLEDIKTGLFDARREALGRDPEWHEIGALVGAPAEGPEFIIGEYAFLLQDDTPVERAPEILGRIYYAEANFRQVLARLNERSQLWNEFLEHRAAGVFSRGEEALRTSGPSRALAARLTELTKWIEEDVTEWIPLFRSLFPDLYRVLNAKYPTKRFIRLWPQHDPKAPPL